ncbi:hypothetical protein BDV93DRAFT_518463 [Ceratobasidium sp. AG-I]|nr:hypothetical protein BDV93DRAFT_518463 [Ceratobasidium sp. AG-I]
MSAPSPTEPSVNAGSAHLAGAKALLAQKMAQQNSNPMTVSPTDGMMTPATAKLSQVKKKHFTKGKPIGGPRFGAVAVGSQKLQDEELSPVNEPNSTTPS